MGKDKHNIVKKSGPGSGFSSTTTAQQGVNFKHKFKKAGTYKLICTLHSDMKLTVKVG